MWYKRPKGTTGNIISMLSDFNNSSIVVACWKSYFLHKSCATCTVLGWFCTCKTQVSTAVMLEAGFF